MALRRLPETLVNRIAAGEVIERPAAAVKELVENALDAGARQVDVVMRDGGRSLILVSDDGCGMTADELGLALERHATSKLPNDDLVNIATLGFRGEALPSIAAVSRLTVTSRPPGAETAMSLAVEGGRKGGLQPAANPPGTRVEVRDLFFATPARLKFLKSARTEIGHARDTLQRLAMAHPEVGFTLSDGERKLLALPATTGDLFEARLKRLAAVMGREFQDNALPIDAARESLRLTGYIGLPTLNRGNALLQYLFVNGRPVRDKLLYGGGARGLSGLSGARSPSAIGSFSGAAAGGGGRQRPSHKGGGALSRPRPGARPDRRRREARFGRRRAQGGDHRGGGRARCLPVRAATAFGWISSGPDLRP